MRPVYLRLTGPLWAWSGILHLNENFLNSTPDSQFLVTEALLLLGVAATVQVHWMLAYPAGRVYRRLAGIYLAVIYGFGTCWNLPYLLVYPGLVLLPRGSAFDITTFNRVNVVVWLAPAVLIGMCFFADRLRSLSPAGRRSVAPLMIAALIQAPPWFFAVASDLWGPTSSGHSSRDAVVFVANVAFGVIGLSGLFFVQRARGNVGDLVVELNHVEPGKVRDALARAVGDPTLEVGALASRSARPGSTSRASAPPAARRGTARHVHRRPARRRRPRARPRRPACAPRGRRLRRTTRARERTAPGRARAQLDELRESRARIVRAGDEERRRLERDLHDGAQQRLLALGMGLQLLGGHVDPSG